MLRISLLSNVTSYKFIQMSAYDTVLDTTYRQGENNKEYSRSEYKKLAIYAENQINFTLAVVIERVKDVDSREPLGYTKEDFAVGMYHPVDLKVLWEPSAPKKVDTSTNIDSDLVVDSSVIEDVELDQSVVNTNLTYISILGSDRFGSEITSFYRFMVEIEYISAFIPIKADSNDKYQVHRVEYNAFASSVNKEFVNLSLLSQNLLGL